MSISDLKSAVPDYAKDLKLNITNVLSSTVLNDQQIWGAALASALSSRNAVVIKAINAEAKEKLSAEAYTAAKSAAAIMGMNNIKLLGCPNLEATGGIASHKIKNVLPV